MLAGSARAVEGYRGFYRERRCLFIDARGGDAVFGRGLVGAHRHRADGGYLRRFSCWRAPCWPPRVIEVFTEYGGVCLSMRAGEALCSGEAWLARTAIGPMAATFGGFCAGGLRAGRRGLSRFLQGTAVFVSLVPKLHLGTSPCIEPLERLLNRGRPVPGRDGSSRRMHSGVPKCNLGTRGKHVRNTRHGARQRSAIFSP